MTSAALNPRAAAPDFEEHVALESSECARIGLRTGCDGLFSSRRGRDCPRFCASKPKEKHRSTGIRTTASDRTASNRQWLWHVKSKKMCGLRRSGSVWRCVDAKRSALPDFDGQSTRCHVSANHDRRWTVSRHLYISPGVRNFLGVRPEDIVDAHASLLRLHFTPKTAIKLKALRDAAARMERTVIEVRKIAKPRWEHSLVASTCHAYEPRKRRCPVGLPSILPKARERNCSCNRRRRWKPSAS